MALSRMGIVGSAAGAAVISLFAIRASLPGPAAPASQGQTRSVHGSAKVSVESQASAEDGPWKASRDHFAGVRPGGCDSIEDAVLRWCVPQDEPVQAMIAIVPDPVNTHMALGFDRSLEAIQLAAESTNYVSDRCWLPWDPSAKLDWQDYDSQQKAQQNEEQKEKQPGLLLFRWNGDVDKGAAGTLYIFIVSETSTSGVAGDQFSNALQYWSEVCAPKNCGLRPGDPGSKQITIMGPTSSGSLASLVRLTKTANEASQVEFKAYSGTVSSICAMQNQHLVEDSDLCDSGEKKDKRSGEEKKPLVFKTFVTDTESAINEFLKSLANDIDCDGAPQVALLFEAATTYGSAENITRNKGGSSIQAAPGQQQTKIGPKKEDYKRRYPSANCATSFSYPREISALRNASQAPADAAAQGTGTPSPYLSFTLADREPNKNDEPPDFSKSQGPLSKEAALMRLAGELTRNQYKYIGVSGSNVLDVLFLAGFLRNACPDARLFVVNADLLFERTLDNAPYIGTLGIATYPLVARNLDWTSNYANLPRLPFPDQYEEGQYNAFLSALKEVVLPENEPSLYEFGEPFLTKPASKPLEETFRSKKPLSPLWLTVVGTGGYWPVRLLRHDGSTPVRPALKREDFSTGWKITLMLLCVLAAVHIFLLETVSPISRTFRDFAAITVMPAQRLFFIHLASAALAAALSMMVMPVWNFGWSAATACGVLTVVALLLVSLPLVFWLLHRLTRINLGWILVFAALILVLYGIRSQVEEFAKPAGFRVWSLTLLSTFLAFSLPLVSWRLHRVHLLRQKWMRLGGTKEEHAIAPWLDRFLREWLGMDAHDRVCMEQLWSLATVGLGVVVWAGLITLGYFWLLLFYDGPDHYGFFLAYRSLYMASGVSPSLPLLPLLATLYCWSILEVWRLRFNNRLRPKLELKPFSPGWETEQSIASAVSRFFLGPHYVFAFIVIFYCWLILFDPAHPFQSFEGRAFSLVYAILFSLGVAMMLSCCLRLWQVWSNLRGLLQELERTHLRFAFGRLKGFSWSPIWRQGGEEADWINMARSSEAIQQINLCAGPAEKATDGPTEMKAKFPELNEDLKAMQQTGGKILGVVQQIYEQKVIGTLKRCRTEYKETLSAQAETPQQQLAVEGQNGRTSQQSSLVELFYNFEQHFAEIQQHFATALGHVMEKLQNSWRNELLEPADGEAQSTDGKVVVVCKPEEPAKDQFFHKLEEYAALRYVAFIRGVLSHIRYLIIFLGTSFSLVLLSLNIYSFEPHQTLIWSFTAIFILVGAVIITVMAQVHRDHILSRVTGTKPNELGLEFYLRIVSFGAVPLLTFLATHFPSIGHYLVSFLQPSLESLK